MSMNFWNVHFQGQIILLFLIPITVTTTEMVDHNGIKCEPQQCDLNQTFKWCNINGGKDQCINCPSHTVNCDRIHTGTTQASELVKLEMLEEICQPIDPCPEYTTTLKPGHICQYKHENNYCECNREHFYYGYDWNACKQLKNPSIKDQIRRKGRELKHNGVVGFCNYGFYKDSDDYSVCKPWTKCNETQKEIQHGTEFKDKSCVMIETPNPLQNTTTTSVNNEQSHGENVGLISGIGVLLLAIVIVVPLLLFIKKQRSLKKDSEQESTAESQVSVNGSNDEYGREVCDDDVSTNEIQDINDGSDNETSIKRSYRVSKCEVGDNVQTDEKKALLHETDNSNKGQSKPTLKVFPQVREAKPENPHHIQSSSSMELDPPSALSLSMSSLYSNNT